MTTPFRTLALVLGLSLIGASAAPADGWAKKKKDESSQAGAAAATMLEFTDTGIAAIDNVFAPAKEIATNLNTSRTLLDSFNTNFVTAMGLAEGTPISDAFAQLKAAAPGMLTVTLEGTKPVVAVKPEAPENVRNAVAVINGGADAIVGTIAAMTQIPEQVKGTIDAAKALPSSLPTVLKDAGASPKDMLAIPKTVGKNTKALTQIPELAKATGESALGTLNLIQGLAQ
jgi:hypothetical protein